MFRKLPAAAALTSFLFLASACPEQQFDEPDYCTTESSAEISTLVLGDPYEGFMPLGPDSYSEVQYGTQGGAMLFFKVRAIGTQMPSCMTVNVALSGDEGAEMASTQVSVRFLADETGTSRTSQALRIDLPYDRSFEGLAATLTATIGDTQGSANIIMHEPG